MNDPLIASPEALLAWYADMGVDDVSAATPVDIFSWTTPTQMPTATPAQRREKPVFQPKTATVAPVDEAVKKAEKIAAACQTCEELEKAVQNFEDCTLKAGATNTVFADGHYGAPLMVIGEAPGRDEDRVGKPFVGRAGQLLDKMLGAIDHSRNDNTLISNVVFWRPPGNRAPTPAETAICRPFVDRLIALTAPKVIILAGGAPLQALFDVTGIMRQRGKWRELLVNDQKIDVMPIFHPAFLLRQPANKRLAWADLQEVRARLRNP